MVGCDPPLMVDGVVYAATLEGRVYALGANEWQFPAEGSIGPVTAGLTYHDGILYVGTDESSKSSVYLIEAATGREICRWGAGAGIVANPLVAERVVYVPTTDGTVYTLPAGACAGQAADRLLILCDRQPGGCTSSSGG
jgi:outer membrane protein assembly factor BamB